MSTLTAIVFAVNNDAAPSRHSVGSIAALSMAALLLGLAFRELKRIFAPVALAAILVATAFVLLIVSIAVP